MFVLQCCRVIEACIVLFNIRKRLGLGEEEEEDEEEAVADDMNVEENVEDEEGTNKLTKSGFEQ